MVPLDRLARALAGRYVIEREVGRGASSVVFLARDLKLDRDVALKVLDSEVASSVRAERFLFEIRATARLNHHNILPLHDSGETGGILYYVIPFVEGQTLRERLRREESLPPREALRIAAEVADALAYAHECGFIHRDIKPENILLGHGGHVYVADFGLARAIGSAPRVRLTSGQRAVGTPSYMSPEQCAGDVDVGSATDVYSLGCVLFEMIAGRPPFRTSTVQALLAMHMTADPPALGSFRSDIPARLEDIVQSTLAKEGTDRPAAGGLADRLRDATLLSAGRRRSVSWPFVMALTVLVVALIAVVPWPFGPFDRGARDGARADTARYVVFPIEGSSAVADRDLASLFRTALRNWRGVEIQDARSVQDELARLGDDLLDLEAARAIALRLGAGRLIMGRVTGSDGEFDLDATVYDATVAPMFDLANARQSLPADPRDWEEPIQLLADSLLFPAIRAIDGPIDHPGTRHAGALRAYAAGHAALSEWDVEAADSFFTAAVRVDESMGEAHLWLSQVRGWASDDAVNRLLAGRALDNLDPTDDRHYRLAQALDHLARGGDDFPNACRIYESLIEEDERDFVAWYGLGECLRRDNRIVSDPASPEREAFRASAYRAIQAYEQAFRIRSAMMTMFSADGYDRLRRLLVPSSTLLRQGQSADGTTFLAYPAWQGDTLAFHPISPARLASGSRDLVPPTRGLAIERMQRRFADLAELWVEDQPGTAEAHEARAVALEMLGDPDALAEFVRARELAADSIVKSRITAEEIWLRLRLSLPRGQTDQLRLARSMADTLLETTESWTAVARQELASLAALDGRTELMAELMFVDPTHASDRRDWGERIARQSKRLLAHAAIGSSHDTLQAIEHDLIRLIDVEVPSARRPLAIRALMGQAARLALTRGHIAMPPQLAMEDRLLRIGQLLADGDTLAASDSLDIYLGGRAASPAERTIDAIFVEAWLLDRLGQTEGAARWLDDRFETLGTGTPALLGNPVNMASLIRAICLRVDIAARGNEAAVERAWRQTLDIMRGTEGNPRAGPVCEN
ncbi:MAG TPA: serine/threonine-protein kinase [Longimicrobiales bacterium]|nr:serine/threonine-protein kinase [Longimicrobiales bacterium]